MSFDHEFDPVTAEEQARRKRDEEFARRVRREVRRMERGEADEEAEAAERAEHEKRERKARRRRSSTFWQLISGTILVREELSRSYPYLLAIAGMFFLSIAVMFTALHLDIKYSRLDHEVKMLHERSIRLQEQRYSRTPHSVVTEELARRGIDLVDPLRPSEMVEN